MATQSMNMEAIDKNTADKGSIVSAMAEQNYLDLL